LSIPFGDRPCLAELERVQEQVRCVREASENARDGTAGDKIISLFEAYGIERLPKASWFETIARTLGMRSREMEVQILAGTFRASLLNWFAARWEQRRRADRSKDEDYPYPTN
jgi:hypothetical protein